MASVSVIIPCFNQAQYLGQAITSVLEQTLSPEEIIVIDDGSTDATSEVAARFGSCVRYIYQANSGLSAARNLGIRAATGNYVGLLDADDLWLPEHLATLVSMLESDSSLGAVYSGCQFVDSNLSPLFQKATRVVPTDRLHDALLDGQFFPPVCALVRKSCFDHVGLFDESLRACEDWDMWLRLTTRHAMAGTPQILSHYRIHDDNMTRDLTRMYENLLAVARKHFGPENGDATMWSVDRQRVFAGAYLWRALAHYRRGEPTLGSEYIRRALATSPRIAADLSFFYRVGCADQPIGRMGDLEHLNIRQNTRRLLDALAMTFGDPNIPPSLMLNRHLAYGSAYFALGLLAYGCGQFGLARMWLAAALWHRPSLLLDRQWAATLVKAILGKRQVSVMKRLAQHV